MFVVVYKNYHVYNLKNRNNYYKLVSPTKLPIRAATQNVFSIYVRSANVNKNQSFKCVSPILINFTYCTSRKLTN